MIARILSRAAFWLHSKPKIQAANASEQRFCEAYARYQDAMRRGDTRAQHDRWEELKAARSEQLKAALPSRAIGWRGL